VPEALALVLALLALAGTLAAAVARTRWPAETVVAAGGATALVVAGALSASEARHALEDLGPTVGFLAALLVLAEGCRREGLFEAMGGLMAAGSRGSPRRLLAMVFAIAAAVTAVLSLDATVVLLTPIVFATAARLRTSPKPHVYACSHLANSASLLLPVSNLTNLLAFHASGLSFTHFAALMALPTVAAVAVEWIVLTRFFAVDLGRPRRGRATAPAPSRPLPRFALAVLGLTLAGFAASSAVGIAPVWVAVAGAATLTLPALAQRATSARRVVSAAEPSFLVFVLGLGVVVRAAADNGLASAVDALLPAGNALPALLGVAAVSAVLANVVNNLPATLMLVPVAAAAGPGPVLAVLVGVNVGPNLTYVGSLATLLWRRVLHVEDTDVELGEFVRLGVLSVPAAVLAATVLLWFSLEVVG
jgi:arsenical pump membrane protein